MIYYPLAVFTGMLILSSPILNGRFALEIGSRRVVFIHYTVAAVTAMALYAVFSRVRPDSAAPMHVYAAGAVGIAVLLLVSYYATRIPAVYVSILPVLGQLIMSAILERNLRMLPGLALVLIGMSVASQKKTDRKPPA